MSATMPDRNILSTTTPEADAAFLDYIQDFKLEERWGKLRPKRKSDAGTAKPAGRASANK